MVIGWVRCGTKLTGIRSPVGRTDRRGVVVAIRSGGVGRGTCRETISIFRSCKVQSSSTRRRHVAYGCSEVEWSIDRRSGYSDVLERKGHSLQAVIRSSTLQLRVALEAEAVMFVD